MARNMRRADSLADRNYVTYEYDGSAARKLQELPQQQERRRKHYARPSARAASRNYTVSKGYVVFLALICVAVSALCVLYLSQKATITAQYENIAQLETEYSELKSKNDAKYNQVLDSVSLEDIKDAAENRLGMSYASADRIIYYDLEDDSYVRQYKDVPTE